MNLRPVFYVNGILLLILAAAMTIPLLVDLADANSDWRVFATAMMATGFTGGALVLMNRAEKVSMTLRETFLFTSLSWLFISAFAAIPFHLGTVGISYTHAFFEAMSGITTTGATILQGLDDMPRGILIWRSMLQWLGGVGFLVIALAVLPMLQISGMQIFKTQSFDVEKIMPSAANIAVGISLVYLSLTILCGVTLHVAGMDTFNAVNHAMTTVSTGGFSTSDKSIGQFDSRTIELILVFFMMSSALPFAIYLRMMRGDRAALFGDSQVRTFLALSVIVCLLMLFYLLHTSHRALPVAVHDALFTTASIMSTTAYAHKDYTQWGPLVTALVFAVTFIGGCSGSTASGIKIFRLQILWRMVQQQISKLTSPHGVFHVMYNGKTIDSAIQASVAGLFFIYIVAWMVFGMILQAGGLDFITAFSGSIAAITNVGTGLGPLVGPAGNFSALPPLSIWTLTFAMLFGRVEFLTLLVVFTPRFWRV